MTRCFFLFTLTCAANNLNPEITPAPSGPYHVHGRRILDANNRPYLIRGTTLPPIVLNDHPSGFGPFSGTTFITIRQRLNMNAVRLPVPASAYDSNERYRARVKQIVQQANQFELLVILESDSPSLAADFKTNPNVFFALPSAENAPEIVDKIRSSGANQPIVIPTCETLNRDCQGADFRPSPSFLRLGRSAVSFSPTHSQAVPLDASEPLAALGCR